ncbi:MAG: CBS domain-containing protein [Dehalococcoidia bacterium]
MKKTVKELATNICLTVGHRDRIYEAIEKIAGDKETMLACVVDEQNVLRGVITPKELLKVIEVREYGATRSPFFEGPEVLHFLTSRYAEDIMTGPISVKADDEIEKAINVMLDEGFYEVPITDKDGKLIGEISYFSIITSSIDYLSRE